MEAIVKKLEEKGVKPTAMRLLILKCFIGSKIALSIGELERVFKVSERSTLFRTLKTFEEKGVVHQIEDGTGVIKYALCKENYEVGNDLHLHFHCNSCDETVCLTEHKIPHINLPEGYITEDINLVIKGICNKCSRESS